ncbi:thioredoxin [Candidatus Woesearchaeota archaeon]|nr:thioredoxin [Candidatus Woesearchaeota archaeon]
MQESQHPREKLAQNKLVLVDFYGDHCAPCKQMAPAIEEVSNAYRSRLVMVKVNVTQNPQIASDFGVMSVPCLMLFKNGELVTQKSGYHTKEALVAWFGKHI